jgi:hypothetical protein
LEYAIEPGGKKPKDSDQDTGEDESNESKGARHNGEFFRKLILNIQKEKRFLTAVPLRNLGTNPLVPRIRITPECFNFLQHKLDKPTINIKFSIVVTLITTSPITISPITHHQ